MPLRRLLLLGPLLGAATVVLHGSATGCGADGQCPRCEQPAARGAVANPALTELSGVAASARHEDVFYAHNDSGDSSRLFVLGPAGEDRGILSIDGAQNLDWEDLAVGPCGAGSCIYIADTGDNMRERIAYHIYRVVEPAVIRAGETELASERIVFTYPDGAHDAEVLLVHPRTGAVTIVTKPDAGPASIFELPLPLTTGKTFMAVKKGELEAPEGSDKFTGGAVDPEGAGVLLRTQGNLFFYAMQPEQSVASALMGEGCALPVADEMNGEAVTWLPSGAGILTVGEGSGQPLHVAACSS